MVLLVFFVQGCTRRDKSKHAKQVATVSPSPKEAVASKSTKVGRPLLKALPTSQASIPKNAHRGGTLRVHLENEPPHLNPLLDTLQVITRVTSGLVYETLLECPGDAYRPGLAKSWEVSSDGLRILLKLREGVSFHDDRPLSGMDVQATIEHVLRTARKASPWKVMLSDIEGVDILPEREVRIRLFRPSDLTLRALCELPILPFEPLRAGGTALAQLAKSPLGTGPYRLAAWERGKRIRLSRAKTLPGMAGSLLDDIWFEIDSDLARALLRARRGEIDVLPRILDAHFPDQVSPATLRDSLDVYLLHPERYSYVILNHRRGALSNPRFREGLSLLWDRARFSEELYHGLAQPIGGPPFGTNAPDPFDPKRAAALFESTGFRDTDGDGVLDIGGEAIRFSFYLPSGARNLAVEVRAFALELRRAGILLDYTTLDPATLMGKVEEGDFDMTALQWEGRRDEDPRLLTSPAGDYQYTGYRSDAFLSLLQSLNVAVSPLGRRPWLGKLALLLATDRPVLYIYRYSNVALISKRVHGLSAINDRLDFRYAWIDP